MVGHLQVQALDPDGVTPSSLSRNVVAGLLKDELGFKGLVFTDALDMKGVSAIPQVTTKHCWREMIWCWYSSIRRMRCRSW